MFTLLSSYPKHLSLALKQSLLKTKAFGTDYQETSNLKPKKNLKYQITKCQ